MTSVSPRASLYGLPPNYMPTLALPILNCVDGRVRSYLLMGVVQYFPSANGPPQSRQSMWFPGEIPIDDWECVIVRLVVTEAIK